MAVAPNSPVYTIIEFNSKKHEVMDFMDTTPQVEVLNDTTMVPRAGLSKPSAGALYSQMNFAMNVAGSGTAGTAPSNSTLLIACGFDQTLNAGTSAVYDCELSKNILSVTAVDIDKFIGNVLKHSCDNARGNMSLNLVAGELLKANFEFQGSYVAPSAASSAADFATTARPVVCKGLTMTVGGQTMIVAEATINLNNKVLSPFKDAAGTNGIQNPIITSQLPTLSVKMVEDIATLNQWTQMTSETKTAFAAALGSTAGNILNITGDWYPLGFPQESDEGEITYVTQEFQMSNIAADTQLTLTFT